MALDPQVVSRDHNGLCIIECLLNILVLCWWLETRALANNSRNDMRRLSLNLENNVRTMGMHPRNIITSSFEHVHVRNRCQESLSHGCRFWLYQGGCNAQMTAYEPRVYGILTILMPS